MERQVQISIGPLSLAALLALFAFAHPAAAAGDQAVTGRYREHAPVAMENPRAAIEDQVREVSELGLGNIMQAPDVPANQDGQEQQTEPSASSTAWLEIAVAGLAPIVLIGLGALMYLRLILPRRQIRPYREALSLVSEQKYDEALPTLTATEGKLPDRLRRDARFFIAFCHYQLSQQGETNPDSGSEQTQAQHVQDAEHLLAALHREDAKSAEPAYLLAWLRLEGKRYDEAEPVLEKMERNDQLGFHHARKLIGIVKFHRAVAASKDGRVEAAAQLFEEVEELGDFADRIPTDLRNQHVVLGTQALFDKDLPAARDQFETLQEAGGQLPAAERDTLLSSAKLGLALACWVEDQADSPDMAEGLLVEAAQLLDPQGPLELPWPEEVAKDIVERLEELDKAQEVSPEKQDTDRCLRDIHFLRGMAVLRSWSRLSRDAAHDAIEETLDAVLVRFALARSLDEDFSDVLLVAGLLKYYLHAPGPKRSQGLDLLHAAQKLGMRDPDAMEIINNRERIEQANADAVDKYMRVLDKYLSDDTVRSQVRVALLERMARYEKIRSWDQRPDLAAARSIEPTVAEMRNRSKILLERVEEILKSSSRSDDADKLRETVRALRQDSERLSKQARAIEEMEAELLAVTGNALLRER